ncbi:DUF4148 domain-containing protein [Burkholderia sp. AU19243]|uniref:DUF4148 domain-containing protein n=1 Tax=Burkholderia TaxID=32008 RepID=UPI000841FA79|nr:MULTISPECIES: DUF4148 domain-containing protein [Burkholderia]MBR7960802.1 DUF4148 domain-containing protein [Burkholderia vietnamiensis]AOK08710.1 hypothetical protein WK25_27900 [Burkholderia latens]MBR8142385.1 DUF4148 domain-containing protein [Burkholderia vietnamiensis]MBR8364352.1 DUF4148 domain-containing protein [Burkholderia sp. AU19243]MBY4696832.1 DUF4148 domain-containing protein [Burkholderia latens]
MKTCIALLIVAGACAAQASFAQSNTPLTRAQVREELMRLEAAGYDPSKGDDGEYPADIQAAQARVAANEHARMAASAAGAPVPLGN